MAFVIDFEHHFVPEEIAQDLGGEIAEALEGGSTSERAMRFWKGVPASALRRGVGDNRGIDEHIADMDVAGIDVSVLSSTAGWMANLEACRFLNDSMAKAVSRYPHRLVCLAHVPPLDGDLAVQEVRRAVHELGHKGVAIPCFVDGRNLDSHDLWPFYEAMNSMKVPIFVHPSITPSHYAPIPETEYELQRALVREFDVMAAVTKLVLGDVLSAFPDLRMVFCHFGGGIAAIKERIQRWEDTFGQSRHFQENFGKVYFAMGGYEVSTIALQCALTGIGADRLIFATDYPYDFRGGGPHLRAWVQTVSNLPIPSSDKEKILGGNAAKLLGMER